MSLQLYFRLFWITSPKGNLRKTLKPKKKTPSARISSKNKLLWAKFLGPAYLMMRGLGLRFEC
jgi:hypothetical protein